MDISEKAIAIGVTDYLEKEDFKRGWPLVQDSSFRRLLSEAIAQGVERFMEHNREDVMIAMKQATAAAVERELANGRFSG